MIIALTIVASLIAGCVLQRVLARRQFAHVEYLHARARCLYEEMSVVVIDNERLRRQGVWCEESGRWMARYIVEVEGATRTEASVSLTLAIKAAARGWPGSGVGPRAASME